MGIFKRMFGLTGPEEQKKEKFRELEQKYHHASEEFSNNLKATWLVSRGNHYGDRGLLDEALKDFEEALQLQSDHLAAHVSRALVYAKKGDVTRAKRLVADMPEEMKIDGAVVGRKTDSHEVLSRLLV